MPTHPAEQWSTATNTAAGPSPVMVVVRSVPHIVSTVFGMMVPSWLRGPRGDPTRDGASRSLSRISRNTRRFEVRTPARRILPSAGHSTSFAGGTLRPAPPRSCDGLRREMGFQRGRRGSRPATPHPASARPDRVAAPLPSVAEPGGGRQLRARRARRGRPERDRTICRWTERACGSSLRPPADQRAPTLQAGDLLLQQFLLEQHFAEPRFQPFALERLVIGGPARQGGFARGKERITP